MSKALIQIINNEKKFSTKLVDIFYFLIKVFNFDVISLLYLKRKSLCTPSN